MLDRWRGVKLKKSVQHNAVVNNKRMISEAKYACRIGPRILGANRNQEILPSLAGVGKNDKEVAPRGVIRRSRARNVKCCASHEAKRRVHAEASLWAKRVLRPAQFADFLVN